MSSDKCNFYQTLEINENAAQEEIKKSYHKLARKWHPDKFRESSKCKNSSCGSERAGAREKHFCSPSCQNTYEEHEKKFKEIKEAHEVLSDPEKRKDYDLNISDKKDYKISNYFKNNGLNWNKKGREKITKELILDIFREKINGARLTPEPKKNPNWKRDHFVPKRVPFEGEKI